MALQKVWTCMPCVPTQRNSYDMAVPIKKFLDFPRANSEVQKSKKWSRSFVATVTQAYLHKGQPSLPTLYRT